MDSPDLAGEATTRISAPSSLTASGAPTSGVEMHSPSWESAGRDVWPEIRAVAAVNPGAVAMIVTRYLRAGLPRRQRSGIETHRRISQYRRQRSTGRASQTIGNVSPFCLARQRGIYCQDIMFSRIALSETA